MSYSYITNPINNQSYNLFSKKGLLTLENYLVGGVNQQELKDRRRKTHRKLLIEPSPYKQSELKERRRRTQRKILRESSPQQLIVESPQRQSELAARYNVPARSKASATV